MHLAYVTEAWPPDCSGAAFTAERHVDWLRARGHRVELIRPRDAVALDWSLALLADVPLLGWAPIAALRRRLHERAVEVVHVATPGPLGRAAVLAANALRLPVSADLRTRWHADSLRFEPRGHLRRLHDRVDRSFVPTRTLRDALVRQGFARLEVLGRGVDPLLFGPQRRSAELRAGWGAARDEQLVMLYVGRLVAEKNVSLALRAFEAMRCLRADTRMVLVGDGPLRARLQAQFPAALFVGTQHGEALARHFASADLFVSPSRCDCFGSATLEALASGLAVVAFDTAAAAEHVQHGRNGLLVAPEDEAGFVAAVARAAALAEPRSALRLQARESVLGLAWDAVLYHFEHVLARLARDAARRPARQVALA